MCVVRICTRLINKYLTKNREKETDEALKKMPKLVEGYYQRIARKDQIENEKLVKKKAILEMGIFKRLNWNYLNNNIFFFIAIK